MKVPTCTFCRRPLEGRQRLVCDRKPCVLAHQIMRNALRDCRSDVEAWERCRRCQAQPMAGSPYCEAHQWAKEPCSTPGCGRKIKRQPGRGGPRKRCEFCAPARRKSWSDTAALDE